MEESHDLYKMKQQQSQNFIHQVQMYKEQVFVLVSTTESTIHLKLYIHNVSYTVYNDL